jgi:hypothetical protein
MAQSPATPPTPAPPKATLPAQSAPTTAAKEKGKAPPKTATTSEGIECSAQADAQGLKGKQRKSFRRKCIADLKKRAKPASAPKG